MGWGCPPSYGIKDALRIIKDISKIDEKINELAIEREKYVKDLEKEIQKINTDKD